MRGKNGSRHDDLHMLTLQYTCLVYFINPLTPNDPYIGRTAPLTSKRCILYVYSTNISTEHFNHVIYSPIFYLKNAVCFIILTYLVLVLFTFNIQSVLKLKKNNNSGAKRLSHRNVNTLYRFIFFHAPLYFRFLWTRDTAIGTIWASRADLRPSRYKNR